MIDRIHNIADTLLAIEAQMRLTRLWRTESPSTSALQSQLPFCCDTLEFSEWLQWVLLPRMKELIEQNRPLPTQSDIYALAQDKISGAGTHQLLQLIKQFDDLIKSSA